MNDADPKYWQGLEELDQAGCTTGSTGGVSPDAPKKYIPSGDRGVSRRSFLHAAGFTVSGALLSACSRGPVRKAIPYLIKSEEITPGKAYWYASACHGCNARCGALVKVRDGRPIKLEGNPQHPVSRGGLCAVGQAGILELYDSNRLLAPEKDGNTTSWKRIDPEILQQLNDVQGRVVLLTGTVQSPSTRYVIGNFLGRFPGAQHIQYDEYSYEGIRIAHKRTHGMNTLPRYRFENAEMIVSFDADFLGTWISPVEFAKGYADTREPSVENPELSYHAQFEGRLSLTGSNADVRYPVNSAESTGSLNALANQIAAKAGRSVTLDTSNMIAKPKIDRLAEKLWNHRGTSLVVAGSNNPAIQETVNFINEALENYGKTIDLNQPSYQWQGDGSALSTLIDDMNAGAVGALIIHDTNPVYVQGDQFRNAMKHVPLTVGFSQGVNETSREVTYRCPSPHGLEKWDDSESVGGVLTVTQPTISGLGEFRTLRACLSRWMGDQRPDRKIIQEYWKENIYPRRTATIPFQKFWDYAVHDGFVQVESSAETTPEYRETELSGSAQGEAKANTFDLVLYQKVHMFAGQHALNPWLQEMPDPVTKVVWENYISIAPGTAKRLGVQDGDHVRLSADDKVLVLPAVLQPGQHENVLGVAVGFGRTGTERFSDVGPDWLEARPTVVSGETVGKNSFPFATEYNGVVLYGNRVTLSKASGHTDLARTQTHSRITDSEKLGGKRRPVIHETTLESFREDAASGNHQQHEPLQLWPNDFEYQGHHWGMAIDLNKCTGCSACLVSCQAENNVPVVGKDEVRRRREMHWIRIDRYYSGSGEDLQVAHQPMMCQHCDHAPCEPVCPVLATMHSEEGINQQIYNRCVGTRYCANNCPYKVRRFNWFDYDHGDEMQRMALNPDVTVRSRGVMEKCSLCIQRIYEVKNRAKREGRDIRDGEIQLACQQSCPTDAIVFGDMNDPESRIASYMQNPRHYRILEEMNFRPSVGYMTLVRNGEASGEEEHRA